MVAAEGVRIAFHCSTAVSSAVCQSLLWSLATLYILRGEGGKQY